MTSSCIYKLLFAILFIFGSSVTHASASVMSDEEVGRWLETLSRFELPEPGHLDSETARLQREILSAPLEEMPPELRTGVALRQIEIYHNNGDWDGVQQLRERVMHGKNWQRADQDVEILRKISGYDVGNVFPARGGRRAGQSMELFQELSLGRWEVEIYNWERRRQTVELVAAETDPHSIRTASLLLWLAEQARFRGEDAEAEEYIARLDGRTVLELYGVGYYDSQGRYVTPEEVWKRESVGTFHLYHRAKVPYGPGPMALPRSSSPPFAEMGPPSPFTTPDPSWEAAVPTRTPPVVFQLRAVPPPTRPNPDGTFATESHLNRRGWLLPTVVGAAFVLLAWGVTFLVRRR